MLRKRSVPFDQIEWSNGYPFTKTEIKFKSQFPDNRIMVKIIPQFQVITNTTYAFNVYNITKTGFMLRTNVKISITAVF